MRKPSTILRRARKLLLEKGWCKNVYAVNTRGVSVSMMAREAAAFCMIGSVERAASEDQDTAYLARERLRDALPKEYGRALASFNDAKGRKKEQIIAVFDKAIAMAKALGQ